MVNKKNILVFSMFLLFFSTSYCLNKHANKSYSHKDAYGVPFDHKLLELLNYENGIFIEVGAFDGVFQSNTKLLEEFYGWSGILVEPSPNLYSKLCANRANSKCFQCALGTFEQGNSFIYGDFNGSPMSGLTGRIGGPENVRVPMRSLQSILDECNISHVNFFSLDTEGYELPILKGIDFSRTVFDYLLIEIYSHQYDELVTFLAEQGYNLVGNFSNYSKETNPRWDGTHNDYLFKHKNL